MGRFLIFGGVGLAAAAGAQQKSFLGTKGDPIGSSLGSGGSGLMPLFQMLLALGLVYCLVRFAMPRLISRFARREAGSRAIVLEDSADLAGAKLYVVSVHGRKLLLAASSTGISNLCDLGEAQEGNGQDEKANEISFMEALERAGEADTTQSGSESNERLEEVLAMLEQPRQAPALAAVDPAMFATRLPEKTEPLPPVSSEPRPWQPRRITKQDCEDEIEAVLRRLQQLDS